MKDLYNPTKPFGEQIRQQIEQTHKFRFSVELRRVGKRYALRRTPEYVREYDELTSTDGQGTKGWLHWQMDTLESGVQDAFGMVVDDLIEGGYTPFTLQDHIIMQEEDPAKIFRLTQRLVELCLANEMSINGGETAILDTINGFEMGITGTGYVRKGNEISPRATAGDILLGIGSSGVHSNGLSFYRDHFFRELGLNLDSSLSWGRTVGEELTIPTHVYLPVLKKMLESLSVYIDGMVHITDGGLSKLREFLPGNYVDINVNRNHGLKPQDIFQYAFDVGVEPEKMYTRFNNGVGYVVAVRPNGVSQAEKILGAEYPVACIGEVSQGNGRVVIESQYDNSMVTF